MASHPQPPSSREASRRRARLRARLHVLLHLFAWSQAGTAARLLLEALMGGACEAALRQQGGSSSWAPCVTSSSGALFLDIAPNALGSFIMGLLAPSAVLHAGLRHRLAAPAPLALLPRASPLQAHAALQVGLRTGFCGSLTTFASWMVQVTGMLVRGDWVEALCALVLGVAVPIAALQVGQQVACAAYARHSPGAFFAYREGGEGCGGGGGGGGGSKAGSASAGSQGGSGTAAAATVAAAPPRAAESGASPRQSGGGGGLKRLSAGGLPQRAVVVEMGRGGGAGASQPPAPTPPPQQQQQQKGLLRRRNAPSAAAAAAAAAPGSNGGGAAPAPAAKKEAQAEADEKPPVFVVREVVEDAAPSYTGEWLCADLLAAGAMLALTLAAAWQVGLAAATGDGRPSSAPFLPTYGWIAVLLAPSGSCARYYLSRLNGRGVSARAVPRPAARWWLRRRERRHQRQQQRLKALRPQHNHPLAALPPSGLSLPGGRVLKWFPWGTFAANVSACALDYACKAGELPLPAGGWGRALLSAVVSGVGGTLSTVSTWVVELQRLMLGYPVDRRGWAYMLWSIGVSLALGIAILGGAVWGGVGAGGGA